MKLPAVILPPTLLRTWSATLPPTLPMLVFAPVLAALVACSGGGTDGPGGEVAVTSGTSAATAAAAAAAGPTSMRWVTPLLDDDGSPAAGDPRAVPADAATWQPGARYATRAQARQLVDALGDGVLQVPVGAGSAAAVDEAVGIAWGLQAAHDLPAGTPVLVSGADLRLAAATAHRLAQGGLTHVWLVTP